MATACAAVPALRSAADAYAANSLMTTEVAEALEAERDALRAALAEARGAVV